MYLAILCEARSPRGASGRSRSARVGSDQLDFPCRSRMIVRTRRTLPKTGDRRQARSLHLERALPMFEIGNNLRAARIRQKLELSQAEGDTRIRAKYLRALEDERFEVLPGPAYTKGFLRTYADYLGLDGQRFVEEYNARLAPEEEPAAPPQLRIRRRRFVLAPRLLAVSVLAASIAVVAWRFSSNGGHHPTAAPPPAQTRTTTRAALPTTPPAARQPLM